MITDYFSINNSIYQQASLAKLFNSLISMCESNYELGMTIRKRPLGNQKDDTSKRYSLTLEENIS